MKETDDSDDESSEEDKVQEHKRKRPPGSKLHEPETSEVELPGLTKVPKTTRRPDVVIVDGPSTSATNWGVTETYE